MENVSKALLMIGGVLIGVLILSLAVYLFATFGAESQKVHKQIEKQQLVEYNSKYTIYTGRTDLTIYDVISVANLAKQNNEYYKDYYNYENEYKVTVIFTGIKGGSTNYLHNIDKEKQQELLQLYNNINTQGKLEEKFTGSTIEYHKNGRVKKISFKTTI